MVLVGTVLPFLVGIIVYIALRIAGTPTLPLSTILGLLHIWTLMAVAFALSSLPSYGLVLLACREGKATPFVRGMFFGLVATIVVAFTAFWIDAHNQIEGFVLAMPLVTLLFALLFTVGATVGGVLGLAVAWVRRGRAMDPE